MTPQETARILVALKTFWPEHKTGNPAEFAAAWHMVLEDFAYADVRRAVKEYAQSGPPFFPTPSQLIAMIANAAFHDIVPDVAWAEVMREVRRHPHGVAKIAEMDGEGQWRSIANPGPSFSHPLIAGAVDGLGWQTICQCEDAQEMQKTFFFTLRTLLERAKTGVKLAASAGPELAPGNVRQLRGKAS